ncbi:MAG: aspartyl protease family protein [Gemmatimonadota bacterium]|nr:aspartyl protease family protein [Gemmatimonadota bacterium]
MVLAVSASALAQEPPARVPPDDPALPDRDAVDDSLRAQIRRAHAWRAAGRHERAVEAYRRAQGLLGLELLYGTSGRYFYDESAAIHRGLAESYLATGEPYAAAVEASRGVNVDETDGRSWTLLGLARYRLADIDGAAEALTRAAEVDRGDPDVAWGLGLVAAARNRLDRAREHGRRALALESDPRYALALARWSAAAGDHRAAAAELGAFLRGAPDDPRAEGYRNLRRFWERIGDEPTSRIDPAVTRIQLNFDLKPGDEIPYVPVRIDDGEPVYVLLDTGAEHNVIDRAYARGAGIRIWPGGRLHGAYRSSPGGYALVDRLALGSARVEHVPFAVGDFAALNLRGQGEWYIAAVINPAIVLRDFLVILDYGHRRIEAIRYDAGGADYAASRTRIRKTVTPFHFDANAVWPVVGSRIDGSRPLPLLADTGASDLLIDRETAAALRIDPRRFSVEAGGRLETDLRGLLLDGQPGETWGIDLEGILGFPFFRGKRVAFDYENMLLILED